jgi:hypothetical protein
MTWASACSINLECSIMCGSTNVKAISSIVFSEPTKIVGQPWTRSANNLIQHCRRYEAKRGFQHRESWRQPGFEP